MDAGELLVVVSLEPQHGDMLLQILKKLLQ